MVLARAGCVTTLVRADPTGAHFSISSFSRRRSSISAFSPRIVALKEILGQLRPEPEREPLSPRRHHEPPSKGRYARRRRNGPTDMLFEPLGG
jgi:hypothetical protein